MAEIHLNTVTGNDANSGSMSNPVQTVSRAISLFTTGDRILISDNSHIFTNHFATKHGLHFDVYGGSNKPVWSGFVQLTGWTNIGNGLWEATHSSLLDTVKQVTLDGIQVEKGRFPKNEQLIISNVGAGTVTNAGIVPYNVVGAEIAIRTGANLFDYGTITAQDGGTLNYSGSMTYTVQNGYGFFVQNHIDFLTDFGEWMYDSSTKKITMCFENANPQDFTIKASALPRLFQTNSGVNDTQIHNIIFEGCNDTPVLAQGGSGYLLDGCEFRNHGKDGFQGENLTGIEIYRSKFDWINNNGIRLKNNTGNSRVEHNDFYDIGLFEGLFQGGTGNGFGVSTAGHGTHVNHNITRRTGYAGVSFEGTNSKCNFNDIQDFCLTLSDGGGLYSRNAAQATWTGAECLQNIIVGSGDASQGTPYTDLQHGVYMDDFVRGVLVKDNYISDVKGRGIYIHNNTHVQIVDNITINCVWGLYSQKDSSYLARNVVVTGNAFIATGASQKLIALHNNSADLNQLVASIGDFDHNLYYHPTPEANNLFRTQSGGGSTDRSFTGFKSLYGWDANSSINLAGYPTEFGFRGEYNATDETVIVSLADGEYEDLAGQPLGATLELPPFIGVVLLQVGDTPPPVDEYTITLVSAAGGIATGGGIYEEGVTATLEAIPDTDYEFDGWSEGGSVVSTSNPWSFVVTGDRTITPVFTEVIPPPVEEYTVTVIAGTGGTVSGGGNYEDGDQATVTATPNTGWHFVRWSNDVTDNPYTFTVTGDVTLQAIFAQDEPTPGVIIVKGKFRIV